MYFEDLTQVRYHKGPCNADEWRCPLLAVGWLEHPDAFSTGEVREGIIESLERFILASWDFYPAYAFRGLHDCSICQVNGKQRQGFNDSNMNIWIPGESVVYLAPAMITHYISEHGYSPPTGFVDAVDSCPEYGSPEYCSALCFANASEKVPLKPKAELESERHFRKADMKALIETQLEFSKGDE